VQERLLERGYNPGSVDGIWGKKTESAIKEFQRRNSLLVTGKLDDETITKLGLKGATVAQPTLVPPDETLVLPEGAQADADRAFAAGYTYYVWPTEIGPIKRGDSTVLRVPFAYVANGTPVPYQTVLRLVATNQDDGSKVEITHTVRSERLTYSSKGKGEAMHIDLLKELSGSGSTKVYLVDYDTGRKQISNEFTIDIELGTHLRTGFPGESGSFCTPGCISFADSEL
jgi:peptidoglycan hydrolase-like protein with peptidoglycan-binding domain